MYLTHLALTDFRIFSRFDQDIPQQLVLLVGDNAQGKTSLLEAIYYLATFTSFHAQTDRQMIHFAAAERPQGVARVVADFVKGSRKHHIEVRLIQEGNGAGVPARFRKEVLLDGVKKNVNDIIGQFNAVIFLPQMTRIIEAGPEERRRFLNLVLSQVVPGYAQALSEYNQALTERNALLKLIADHPGSDADQLVFWDTLISKRGAELMVERITAIKDLERLASRIHARLTNANEILRMLYQPAYEPLNQPVGQYSLPIQTSTDRTGLTFQQIQEGFSRRLLEVRGEEIARGITAIGPHRDEVRFLANGIDLGNFGSRGQIRTALLSLKLAEVAWMKEKTGHAPVLLLDEVMAELDIKRRSYLTEVLNETEQGLLTTTDLNMFADQFSQRLTLWEVRGGMVEQLNIPKK
jgi:DNA replication and repair protein RecF